MGITSIRRMQAMMVWLFFSANLRDMIGQVKAPAMPDVVATIDSTATSTVLMWSSVRANRTAVPLTVATASERRNQATRNKTTCRSFAAVLIVFHNETHAKEIYAKNGKGLIMRPVTVILNGGPGRVRSHKAEGMENTSHHKPTKNRTRRSGIVCDERSGNTFLKL
jgi:hypothetical protein